MNAIKTVELLRRIGLFNLIDTEGCICGECSIQGVNIDISCRKSSGSGQHYGSTVIRIYSSHLDSDLAQMHFVAQEVVNQVHEIVGYHKIVTRFCSYQDDNPPKCIYCSSVREDKNAYLCNSCLTKKDSFGYIVADQWDYSRIKLSYPSLKADE